MDSAEPRQIDVVVIGGGQSGLATGYYLRRTGLEFVILDAEPGPGGAWRHGWESLHLFSPARWSSLPGWIMQGGPDWYPGRDDFLTYMDQYERRYQLPIERPVTVIGVYRDGGRLRVESDHGVWLARAVVSATGTWGAPIVPYYPAQAVFRGEQIHSAEYTSPLPFVGKRVLVIGGGNSGAQIVADLADYAEVTWVTRREPTFLPDDVDGRDLFDIATARYLARQEGQESDGEGTRQLLGDIVAVPPVRAARDRGKLVSRRPFTRFTPDGVVWPDGCDEHVDAVIWCTGFRYTLDVLQPLGVITEEGIVEVDGTRSVREPRLWLVGYGEWTGDASATIIGVGRTARQTVREIGEVLSEDGGPHPPVPSPNVG
jgi:cation diffusion facilitator CzcD-associated flavoprotein CzcO